MKYRQASDILGTRQSRKVGNNTYLQRRDADTIAVMLHATDVVTFHKDGTVTLNTGGWYTVTTKARMNDYAPVSVYSDRGEWYVYPHDRSDKETRVPFFDGIRVTDAGDVVNPPDPAGVKAAKAERDATKKRIRAYVRGFVANLADIPDPSGGDCWYCCMFPDGADASTDHLEDHIRESYYVPSLALRALAEAGYRDPGFIWRMAKSDAENGRTRPTDSNIARAITRYMEKRLVGRDEFGQKVAA